MTALLAPVEYYDCPFKKDALRFHHATALALAIARVHIHMLAPETGEAMIRVAVTENECFATLTGEIFSSTLETFRKHFMFKI